jgi:phosphate transport system permease protein
MSKQRSFSGRERRLTNRASVKLVDIAARVIITVAGVGTIGAVSTVFVFLLMVVMPMFGSVSVHLASPSTSGSVAPKPTSLVLDEYGHLVHVAGTEGKFASQAWSDATLLAQAEVAGNEKITAIFHPPLTSDFAEEHKGVAEFFAGDDQGGLRIVSSKTIVDYPDEAATKEAIGDLSPGQAKVADGVLYVRGDTGILRSQKCEWSVGERLVLADKEIEYLNVLRTGSAADVIATTIDGGVHFATITQTTNLLDEVTLEIEKKDITPHLKGIVPKFVVALNRGSEAIVLSEAGRMLRFDMKRFGESDFLLEDIDTLSDKSSKLTAAMVMQGGSTLILADSSGGVAAWFAVRSTDQDVERTTMKLVHQLPSLGSPVTRLARSTSSRVIAAMDDAGKVNIYHVTSRRRLATLHMDKAATAIAFSPHNRIFAGVSDTTSQYASLDLEQADASLAALFRPVWYEGYDRPEHIWQAAAGSEIPEPKYGMIPLVFGTLKATLYSMLFAAPLALLAALYTSEFLSPPFRQRVKPVIEMMAGLPSVVLGYIAAMMLAPLFEQHVARYLAMLITAPLGLLIGAQIWLMLPHRWTLLLSRWKLVGIALALGLGAALGWPVGPVLERLLFAGDIKLWLNGNIGSGFAGWMILFLPLSLVVVLFAGNRLGEMLLGPKLFSVSATSYAWMGMAKIILGTIAVAALASGVAAILTWMGWDSRGGVLDTYVQRNALMVGLVMGFAVIPLIYTIAEDALSTVPQHLRSASLGAGATPWQTAVRVVVPTAMSGLFSALMIGLGRAVGETMIVVMATGNSPVMSWNAFNGMRTLSATIAVEMPDADPGGTHYRLLFLAALILFSMTFVVNTIAEIVRMRFRRRAYQL